MGFFPTRGDGAIASLDWSKQERQKLAKASLGWKCEKCGSYNLTALPPEDDLTEELEENNIQPFRLKNKEEQEKQEKEEAEKKREQEELKKQEELQQQSSQIQTPSTQDANSSFINNTSQTIHPQEQEDSPNNGNQIHRRREHKNNINNLETDPISDMIQTPNPLPIEGESKVRLIDILIMVLFLLLSGLLFKKFLS